MRTFLLILVGRSVSLAGSQLTAFGLGVWLYQGTGSVWLYSLVTLASLTPRLVMGPLAGMLADTWDRRTVLIIGQAGSGVCALLLVLLFAVDALGVWTVLPLVALSSCFDTLEFPAFSAATTALVPPERLSHANGMVHLGLGLCQVGAPAVAGVLLDAVGLGGILAIDAATFVFATLVLLRTRIPHSPQAGAQGVPRPPLLQHAAIGWRYVRSHRGLLALLLLLSVASFNLGMVQILFAPLVLGFGNARALGLVQSVGGTGFMAGSMAVMLRRSPQRAVDAVLGALLFQGLVLFLAAAQPSLVLACVGAFSAVFTFPLIGAHSEAIWQRQVPIDLQGRASSTRAMAQQAATLLASAVAGPLADHVFEPLMASGGQLAASAGRVLGSGPGRGVALLMTLIGSMTVSSAVVGFLNPSLRQVDDGRERR